MFWFLWAAFALCVFLAAGCFMLLNTGTEAVPSKHGLLTTIGYKLGPED